MAKFCSECGKPVLREGSPFCPECGAKIPSAPPIEQKPVIQPVTAQQPAHPSWYIPPVNPASTSVQTPAQQPQGSMTESPKTVTASNTFKTAGKWIAICGGGAVLVLILATFIVGMAGSNPQPLPTVAPTPSQEQGITTTNVKALAHEQDGISFMNSKEYEKALSEFDQAIELDPQFLNAYIDRGGANFMLKNYNGAALDFTKAIDIEKNSPNPSVEALYSLYVLRGTSYMFEGDDPQAKLDIMRIETYYPDYVPSDENIVQLRDKLIEHYNPGKTFPTTPNNPTETSPTMVNDQTTKRVTPTPRDTYKPYTTAPIIHPYTYRPEPTQWDRHFDWYSDTY
jgi:hypothetical protein